MTAAAAPTISAGIPVALGSIDRELKKLWAQSGDMMTRASLINLAIYSEEPGSLERNTALISEVTQNHACRALVIEADPTAGTDQVQAMIGAHCHVGRSGAKQICSEQLSFIVRGSMAKLLPNIVFSHLDSDLPFYLWWQGEFADPMDPQLWSWVDRLLYDSVCFRDWEEQSRLVRVAQAEANHRVVLCDFNWMRLVQIRLALAQFFDHPSAEKRLQQIERIEIEHAPGFRSTATMLTGWFAGQLGWDLLESGKELRFNDQSGRPITVKSDEHDGEPIGRCSIFCDGTELRVVHRKGADLLDVSHHLNGSERMHQLMPAGKNDPARLLREELLRGGPHRVYLRAIEAVRGLL